MRALARCEGIFAGVSSGGCVAGALRLSGAHAFRLPALRLLQHAIGIACLMRMRAAAEVENCTIVCIICDRGVRLCIRHRWAQYEVTHQLIPSIRRIVI
jgi:cysteine synthase